MKTIQQESISTLLAIIAFCVLLIGLIIYSKARKAEKEKDFESHWTTKRLSWNVYLIAGFVIIIMLLEIKKRIFT